MTDVREILKDIQDDLAVITDSVDALAAENGRLTFENGALRERLRLSEEENYSDDLADARRDRERDADWAKSEAQQDRGARDY